MSNIINKIKDKISGHGDDTTTGTSHSTGVHDPTHTHHTGTTGGLAGTTHTGATTGMTGTTHTGGMGSHTTAGPHSSDMMNKADPRVDSDLDGSRTVGNTGTTGMTGTTGGMGYSAGTTGYGTSTTHNTGLGSTHGTGLGSTHGTGMMGTTHNTGMTGTTHNTGMMGTTGGPAPNTAGPHSSDMMNKMDPRVDSDLDGSKTYGGNATYQS